MTYVALGLIFLCQPLTLSAQDREQTEQELRALEDAIDKKTRDKEALDKKPENAETAAEEISQQLVTAAKNIRITEENATRLEVRIADLETEAAKLNQDLAARQSELLELLSALERLAKRPAALALLQPREALTTARSASLMGTIVPEISAKAELLKTDLNTLAAIQTDTSRQRFNLKNTLERLTERQLNLASLLERRKAEASSARSRAQATEREIRQFASEAQNLRELLERLARSAAKAAAQPRRPAEQRPRIFRPGRPITELKGALPQPATGRIIGKFGARLAVGKAQGIRIRTRANAQVVAPYDGEIVFAGPFKAYGQLLIIEHTEGYYSLLSGLGAIQAGVGQWVLTGEPVGTMNAKDGNRELYMEMRRGRQAF
ncbi:MAG: murein hydrolase activator EnvC, partial [Kordiimonas sp.]